ncbi:MAG: GntR family transcriptional regulator [Planctomycetes bacterium]|nr:GntR family transcriptional regulator [Planctomycetota bacterium]
MNTDVGSAQLSESLLESIEAGRIEAGSYLPSVRELSERHGVAHNTAWRALKTLERQGLVVAQPRRGYRVLGGDRRAVKPIAYVLSRENYFAGWALLYQNLLAAFESGVAAQRGCLMKLIMSPGEERMILDQLKHDSLSGLVVDAPNPALLDWAKAQRVPAVVIDDWLQDLPHDAVVQDNFAGGQLAAKYLVERGCRRIAWFGRSLEHYHAHGRYGGALPVLRAAGRAFERESFLELDEPAVEKAAYELLARADRPDGVLALWRHMTVPLVRAAKRLGLKIGKDLHLVSWLNEEAVETAYVPLFEGGAPAPAVLWRAADMAHVALGALAQRRADPGRPRIVHQVPMTLQTSF